MPNLETTSKKGDRLFFGPVRMREPDGTEGVHLRIGGGIISCAGAALILGGGILIVLPYLLEFSNDAFVPPLVFLVGGGIVATGMFLLLSRKGRVVDPDQSSVELWWGLLVPFWKERIELSQFDEVILKPCIRRLLWFQDYECFSVAICGDSTSVVLGESLNWETARKIAEEVASRTCLPLQDTIRTEPFSTSIFGESYERTGEIDESRGREFGEAGHRLDLSPPPDSSELQISESVNRIHITLPPVSSAPVPKLLLAGGISLASVVFAIWAHQLGGWVFTVAVAGASVILAFALPKLSLLPDRKRITIGFGDITLEKKASRGAWQEQQRMSLNDFEKIELEVSGDQESAESESVCQKERGPGERTTALKIYGEHGAAIIVRKLAKEEANYIKNLLIDAAGQAGAACGV
ncbi:MAG: hypothetical protein KGZ25_13330 [Planctomycetes bacterium]|nr:hypothetical protein [Planctomycetota bacterium]